MIAQAATFVKGFLKLSRSFFEKRHRSRLPFRKKANKFRKISCAGTKNTVARQPEQYEKRRLACFCADMPEPFRALPGRLALRARAWTEKKGGVSLAGVRVLTDGLCRWAGLPGVFHGKAFGRGSAGAACVAGTGLTGEKGGARAWTSVRPGSEYR